MERWDWAQPPGSLRWDLAGAPIIATDKRLPPNFPKAIAGARLIFHTPTRNPSMKHILAASILSLILASVSAFAEEKAATAPKAPPTPAEPSKFKPIVDKLDLKDGDTVVFLGDSITHQCLYTQYVEDYFYTRYPKLHIHFHNAGVGGDRASDALTRFDEDVAPYKPKYVSILLGMNDGGYKNYQQPVFDTYMKDMTTLLDKIAALGATAVPMTPTMFDARAKRMKGEKATLEPRDTFYNGVLALYGAWLDEMAEERGLGFVDMWAPLNELTTEQRKKNPDFTMIPDGVHPGAAGQTVMAVAVIEDMVAKVPVSQIMIADKDGKPAPTANGGVITDFQGGDSGVSFTFAAERLPWVLPADAAEGYKLTHAGHHYSNEKVTVRGLKPGKYNLKIEDEIVGSYTEGQLAFGVELEENPKTPEYKQALKVADLNKQRNEIAYHPLRDQYAQLKGKRRELAKIAESDPQYQTKKAEFEQWYAGQKAKVAELFGKALEIENQIYSANQPPARKYEVSPAPAVAAK
jgi:lysophospholipase L1-like esterase